MFFLPGTAGLSLNNFHIEKWYVLPQSCCSCTSSSASESVGGVSIRFGTRNGDPDCTWWAYAAPCLSVLRWLWGTPTDEMPTGTACLWASTAHLWEMHPASSLRSFRTCLESKTLSSLVWFHSWPCLGQRAGLESSRGLFQCGLPNNSMNSWTVFSGEERSYTAEFGKVPFIWYNADDVSFWCII